VVLLEKEAALAQHQSSRNSGVVHAGIYYAAGSLKARLCRAGGERLRAFCEAHSLPYEACGKVVVARDVRELERLKALEERAGANGVPSLARLDEAALHELEPHVTGIAALHSPSSAIVDFGAVVRAMAGELTDAGGEIRLSARVTAVRTEAGRVAVSLADGSRLDADRAVVCAGLYADRLARASGRQAAPRIVPFRGEFWRLRPERRELVRGLIYPVPDPSLPFLGVHFTPRIDGEVWIGPNAVLALAREGYRWRTISLRDVADTFAWPGTWRMAAHHWRTAIDELTGSVSKRVYLHDARSYIPGLAVADVTRAPAGVRAQALDPDGSLVDDFRLERAGPVVWVRNAPSTAATSSLAIADELVDICVRKHLPDTL
ncbi:MAG: L-2-hydroxyglutarate oxidase, partial [Solirubrobacteraceae bacterium]